MNDTRSDYITSIAETALGPVEYAIVGTGTPVVVVHGSPGGIDAAELMARILPGEGVAAILLSRPGYLGTPLADRTTIDEQADLIAALLDHLEIARAGVYTWSGAALPATASRSATRTASPPWSRTPLAARPTTCPTKTPPPAYWSTPRPGSG